MAAIAAAVFGSTVTMTENRAPADRAAERGGAFQDQLLDYCASLTGTALPADPTPSG
jgi:hypothetical protein